MELLAIEDIHFKSRGHVGRGSSGCVSFKSYYFLNLFLLQKVLSNEANLKLTQRAHVNVLNGTLLKQTKPCQSYNFGCFYF